MPVIVTHHADLRAEERFVSVMHAKTLFKKALKSARKGIARQYLEEGGKIKTVWNKLTFIHAPERNGNVLVTLYKRKP